MSQNASEQQPRSQMDQLQEMRAQTERLHQTTLKVVQQLAENEAIFQELNKRIEEAEKQPSTNENQQDNAPSNPSEETQQLSTEQEESSGLDKIMADLEKMNQMANQMSAQLEEKNAEMNEINRRLDEKLQKPSAWERIKNFFQKKE